MVVKLPPRYHYYSTGVKTGQKERRTILLVVLTIFVGINISGRLSIKDVDSCLDYESLNSMTCVMETLMEIIDFSYGRLKVLENTTVVLAKATFNELQDLKTTIIGHEKKLLTKPFGIFWT